MIWRLVAVVSLVLGSAGARLAVQDPSAIYRGSLVKVRTAAFTAFEVVGIDVMKDTRTSTSKGRDIRLDSRGVPEMTRMLGEWE